MLAHHAILFLDELPDGGDALLLLLSRFKSNNSSIAPMDWSFT